MPIVYLLEQLCVCVLFLFSGKNGIFFSAFLELYIKQLILVVILELVITIEYLLLSSFDLSHPLLLAFNKLLDVIVLPLDLHFID